jgi:hypothetical protein
MVITSIGIDNIEYTTILDYLGGKNFLLLNIYLCAARKLYIYLLNKIEI